LRVLPNGTNGRPNESESYHYFRDNAQELLFEQFITDIAVDGANNKWIGTADSGLFSPVRKPYHFTINNRRYPAM
jgi:hypothetical protein